MDDVFNAIYIMDFVIKIIGYGVDNYFKDPWCKFDFFMLMITVVTYIGIAYLQFLKGAK